MSYVLGLEVTYHPSYLILLTPNFYDLMKGWSFLTTVTVLNLSTYIYLNVVRYETLCVLLLRKEVKTKI